MNKNNLNQNDKVSCTKNMKPVYSTNEELMCGVIKYNNKTYLIDLSDKDKIINFNKTFIFTKETDIYPSYSYNYKRFSYLDFIFSFNQDSVHYIFKNGNHHDLRKINVEIYHFYHKYVIQHYNVIEYINGHYLELGHDANIMKNPIWRIKENDKEYLLLYCENNTLCKLCTKSYQIILNYELNLNNGKKITWYKQQNGYICCSIGLYIHQIITGCYGNGKGIKNESVDHIDQNPLNNTWDNLHIATLEIQQQNSKGIKPGTKRERKSSAQDLPNGITQDMLPKYICYVNEKYGKENKMRDFFRVEKHPKLDKTWSSSKSCKQTIQEKLNQAIKMVNDLDNNIYPKIEKSFPKYYSKIISRGKPHLVYERRLENGMRENVKMVLPEEYDLEEQLIKIMEKVNIKYNVK